MRSPSSGFNWKLWWQWILATAAGLCVGAGIFLSVIVPRLGEGVRLLTMLPGAVLVVAGAAIVGPGVTQWLVLRRHVRKAGWWLLATALGATVGLVAAVTVVEVTFSLVVARARISSAASYTFAFVGPMAAGGASLGVAIGIPQWLVLFRRDWRTACWVLVSVAGWAAALPLGEVVLRLSVELRSYLAAVWVPLRYSPAWIAIASVGMVVGVFTGVVLAWLLPRPACGKDQS